ncbi:SLIT-ROBO Rho GTPase-activating protein 1-like isoform X2 [Uloborus diversus]|uniref:SLIT-ROBO Rho GTPase-activating protein 1-like isoform X2 n=1 Tax=Uloborus diversus TaxID=327109 RepID=UPI00240A72E3|nr:SLIT-ROBO Rho GTPase-activating protein 1-like isoform X2 [Uloborus diversus]
MSGRPRLRRAGTLRRSHFYNNIRQQLNEQLKCLDVRVETQVSLVSEIQDYFRRRAEVELEYSKSLEKLAKGLMLRHKQEKQKREQWHLFSSYACWQQLISTTRRQSRDHAAISEIYASTIINRMTCIMEDVQRIYKRCREVGIEIHDELLKVLHELHTTMKTYYTYHNEEKQAEGKLSYVEAQKNKLEQSIPKEKLQRSKKFRLMEKEIQKRRLKYNDAKLKALKARNDYLLCMDASNAAIHKYFVDDLSDIIDCMDFGFHTSLAHTLMVSINAEECLKKSQQASIDGMNKCITNLDSRVDKQRFLEYNNSAFMVPKKFEFQAHKGDEVTQITVEKPIQDELEQRFKLVNNRLTSLKTESEEVWKTLETAEKTLLEMLSTKDFDCTLLFEEDAANRTSLKQPETVALKRRADKQETEDFYLNKFSEYIMTNNLISRLQAKSDLIRRGLGIEGEEPVLPGGASPHIAARPHNLPQRLRKKRIGRTPLVGQPKLFGGSLEEYLEATNQEIPLIIRSCIRVINLYGLHHQGIFRVSGSQVEINNFRETFERGEDPLADVSDASDINSVGGVLKLYLRELREPLFPIFYFDQLVDISQVESKKEFIYRVREVVNNLPRTVVVVLRYLFAFLNHLSEFSDENMMDPYNLAICFGPTLLPIPEDKDQVQYQNLVNELIKNIIIYQEEIFPDDGGIIYEKYISTNVPDENDVGDSPPDPVSDITDDSEVDTVQSEDDAVFPEQEIAFNLFGKTEVMEAVAQFDFNARSQRELSFKKGDTLLLQNQVSNDWWKGSFLGKEGLIPDKYILLKIRDEDKDKSSIDGSEKRRTSSSSDSLSGISHSPKSLSTTGVPEDCSSTSSLDRRSLNSLPPQTPEWEGSHPFQIRTSDLLPEESANSLEDQTMHLPDPPDLGATNEPVRETAIIETQTFEDTDRRPKKSRKDAPDLVLDLPINLPSPVSGSKGGKSSPDENSILSPVSNTDSPELTAAERFAKSNQCTMKKGTMSRSASHVTGPQSLETHTHTFHLVRRSASTGDNLGPASPDLSLDSKEKAAQRNAQSEQNSSQPTANTGLQSETVELNWVKSDKAVNDVLSKAAEFEAMAEKKDAKAISSFKPAVKSKPPPVMKKPNRAEIKEQEVYQQTAC